MEALVRFILLRKIFETIKDILKKDSSSWVFVSLLFLLIFIDQVSKKWIFHEHVIYNENLLLGINFGGIEEVLKHNIYSLVLSACIFFYILAILTIRKEQKILKYGITILLSGVFSNIFDKLYTGHVIDFIRVPISKNQVFFLNGADILQTIGWLVIGYTIFQMRKVIWRNVENRSQVFVSTFRKEQVEFILYVSLILVCAGLYATLFVPYYFSKIQLDAEEMRVVLVFKKYFIVTYSILAFLLFIVTIYVSNKIYGPVYAFTNRMREAIRTSQPSKFSLRKGDQFKELESLYREIVQKISKH